MYALEVADHSFGSELEDPDFEALAGVVPGTEEDVVALCGVGILVKQVPLHTLKLLFLYHFSLLKLAIKNDVYAIGSLRLLEKIVIPLHLLHFFERNEFCKELCVAVT